MCPGRLDGWELLQCLPNRGNGTPELLFCDDKWRRKSDNIAVCGFCLEQISITPWMGRNSPSGCTHQ